MNEINEKEENNEMTNKKEIESIFQLLYQEKIEELSSYILNEQNEIWNIKREDDITILHSSCVLDKSYIIQTIIEKIKTRLHINLEDSLSLEDKNKNMEIFKNFIKLNRF